MRDGNLVDVLGTTVELYDANDEEESNTLDLAEACQRTIESTYADVSARTVTYHIQYIPWQFQDPKEVSMAFKSLGIGSVWLKRRRTKHI